MTALRVAIADDSALIREGVAHVLDAAGFEVVARAADAGLLMAAIEADRPDVVVTDMRMPPTHTDEGLRAAREIRSRYPTVGVVVLSQYAEPDYVTELLADGADGIGYLLKDRIADVDDFAASVRRVAAGGSVLDPAVVDLLVTRRQQRHDLGRSRNDTGPGGAGATREDMERVMLEHAIGWAREHGRSVARQVGSTFVAVTPNGDHSFHGHFYEALDWLDAHGSRPG